jgi:hypothetical protein
MYGVEVRGLNEVWKAINKVYGKFCKKLILLPSCATSGYVEIELVEESMKG